MDTPADNTPADGGPLVIELTPVKRAFRIVKLTGPFPCIEWRGENGEKNGYQIVDESRIDDSISLWQEHDNSSKFVAFVGVEVEEIPVPDRPIVEPGVVLDAIYKRDAAKEYGMVASILSRVVNNGWFSLGDQILEQIDLDRLSPRGMCALTIAAYQVRMRLEQPRAFYERVYDKMAAAGGQTYAKDSLLVMTENLFPDEQHDMARRNRSAADAVPINRTPG